MIKIALIVIVLLLVPLSVTVKADVDTIWPSADSITEWSITGAGAVYVVLSDADDGTYISETDVFDHAACHLTNPVSPQSSTIDSVVYCSRHRKNLAFHTVGLVRYLVQGGSTESASELTVTATKMTLYEVKIDNPDGGAWDSTDVANTVIGVSTSTMTDGGIGVPIAYTAQGYLLVYYTEGAPPASSAAQVMVIGNNQ